MLALARSRRRCRARTARFKCRCVSVPEVTPERYRRGNDVVAPPQMPCWPGVLARDSSLTLKR
jgi:hypothetical protein